ncbi:MAG: dipeptidase [Thermomicrobiales bacterium]
MLANRMMGDSMASIPVFDGHNDTVLSLRDTGRSFFERSEVGHIDLPRALEGGLAGGFFAVWVPNPEVPPIDPQADDPSTTAYGNIESMPTELPLAFAEHYALVSLASLARVSAQCVGKGGIGRNTTEIRRNLRDGVFSMELHIEGAEPIDPSLSTLEAFYLAGIRSIGLVWSRPNAFAHGVPFQFPGTPDTGPGLTDAGRRLVAACDELGIVIDMSHLNEAGFWDVAKLSKKPLVCTHSGVHAICPSTRNLTDKQLDAIRDSTGIVGVNFHAGFVNPDGENDPTRTTVGSLADHVDYLCNRMGSDKVALGSDFDGATMPGDIKDAAGLPVLLAELERRGYDASTIRNIAWDNWLRVLDQIWIA